MTIPINWICFGNHSGYSQAAQDMILALYGSGKYDIRVQYLFEKVLTRSGMTENRFKFFESLTKKPKVPEQIQIYHCIPPIQRNVPKCKRNIGIATFETFGPPSDGKLSWVSVLNTNDAIITPSQFNFRIFAHEKITKPLFYIPHCYDTELFHPDVEPLCKRDKFTFLFFGAWRIRKGYQQLIEAWFRQFSSKDNVQLIIKTDKPQAAQSSIDKIRVNLGFEKKDIAPILYEREVFDEISLPRFLKSVDCLVLSTLGEGFCTLPDAQIKTPNGVKNIKDIKVNDYVFSHRGNTNRVSHCFERNYIGDVVRISCFGRNNQLLTLTPNHMVRAIKSSRLSARTVNRKLLEDCEYNIDEDKIVYKDVKNHFNTKYTKYNLEWIKAEDLSKNDLLFYPKLNYLNNENITKQIELDKIDSISKRFNIMEGKIYKKISNQHGKEFKSKQVLFDRINIEISEDFMKLLGYYVAEGCCNKNGDICFSFHSNEKLYHNEVMLLMKKHFDIEGSIQTYKNKQAVVIRFYSTVIAEMLYNLFGHKARNKKIPSWIFCLDDKYKIDFLHGLFNGDGCYKGLVSFSSSSVNLANNVFDMLHGLGISSTIKKRIIQNKEYYSLLVNSKAQHNAIITLFGRKELLESTRTYQTYLTRNNFQLLKVRSTERKHYDGLVYNLGVENDNSYICENIAIHNCLPGLQCMALGVPVAITNFSGCQDYAKEETCTLIQPNGFMLYPCMDSLPQYRNCKWVFITVQEICRVLKYTYDNQDEIRKKAVYAESFVRSRFTYGRVQNDFVHMLKEVYNVET